MSSPKMKDALREPTAQVLSSVELGRLGADQMLKLNAFAERVEAEQQRKKREVQGYSLMGPPQCVPPSQTASIGEVLGAHGREIERLLMLARELHIKLEPVIGPPRPEDPCSVGESRQTRSPLCNGIEDLTEMARNVAVILADLLERCEL